MTSQTTLKPPPFYYHPAYGLPDETRLAILAYADTHTVREAALVYHVSESVIYLWRKALKESAQ